MIYILVLIIWDQTYNTRSYSVTMQEFTGQEDCLEAGNNLLEKWRAEDGRIFVTCEKK